MRHLTLGEVVELHRGVLAGSGGLAGVRDRGALEAALAQPRMTFDGVDLYASPVEKAAALAFSLVMNHPFLDGNMRVAHAAMETFLLLNGLEIDASIDEQVTLGRLAESLVAVQGPERRMEPWRAESTLTRRSLAAARTRNSASIPGARWTGSPQETRTWCCRNWFFASWTRLRQRCETSSRPFRRHMSRSSSSRQRPRLLLAITWPMGFSRSTCSPMLSISRWPPWPELTCSSVETSDTWFMWRGFSGSIE